jgi:hypothetical protein
MMARSKPTKHKWFRAAIINCETPPPFLIIPYRDEEGRIQACQLRAWGADADKKKRYCWLSSTDGSRPRTRIQSISKEHDGFGVIGENTKTAVKKAASQSGFENAELVEKNFI